AAPRSTGSSGMPAPRTAGSWRTTSSGHLWHFTTAYAAGSRWASRPNLARLENALPRPTQEEAVAGAVAAAKARRRRRAGEAAPPPGASVGEHRRARVDRRVADAQPPRAAGRVHPERVAPVEVAARGPRRAGVRGLVDVAAQEAAVEGAADVAARPGGEGEGPAARRGRRGGGARGGARPRARGGAA